MFKEFKEFISKGNVMDLAVGVIIGAAFGKIVTSLVDDIIMPIIGIILGKIDFNLEKYNNELNVAREKLKSFDYKKFAEENNFGLETVKDVHEALLKDRRDPRDDFEKPLLKSDILNIDNLQVGMELEGTVRNVVKFGAFIDIGLKNDALLHVSEISDKYIDDPSKVLSVGQIIKVKIKDVDKDRGRVGLTRKGQN